MPYHVRKITKGKLGYVSKIQEEVEELLDAEMQFNPVMAILECSDIIGAIEAYIKQFNLTLNDLIIMKDATKSAFEDGTRND